MRKTVPFLAKIGPLALAFLFGLAVAAGAFTYWRSEHYQVAPSPKVQCDVAVVVANHILRSQKYKNYFSPILSGEVSTSIPATATNLSTGKKIRTTFSDGTLNFNCGKEMSDAGIPLREGGRVMSSIDTAPEHIQLVYVNLDWSKAKVLASTFTSSGMMPTSYSDVFTLKYSENSWKIIKQSDAW